MTFGIQTEAAVMPMTDISVRLPRDSTFGFFSPNLHAHAYLHQNSPSMKGLADVFTTTQTHRAAYPLNITSIPLIYFIANHFKETISGFSSLGLPVCVCVWFMCVRAHVSWPIMCKLLGKASLKKATLFVAYQNVAVTFFYFFWYTTISAAKVLGWSLAIVWPACGSCGKWC